MAGLFTVFRNLLPNLVIAVVLLATAGSSWAQEPTWQSQDKTVLVTQCFEAAQSRMVSSLSQQLQDALPGPAMQALLVSNSQELMANCQCLFSRLTNLYSPQDFSSRPDRVLADAQALTDEGGACASDIDAMLERTRQRLEDQLAGLAQGGARNE